MLKWVFWKMRKAFTILREKLHLFFPMNMSFYLLFTKSNTEMFLKWLKELEFGKQKVFCKNFWVSISLCSRNFQNVKLWLDSMDSEIWILVKLGLESCSKLLKSKFRTFKIAKNDIFGPFEFANIWFHIKLE